MNEFHIEVKALDAGQGYLLIAIGIVDGAHTQLQEHYDTEIEVRDRLATAWQWWADQVDAE